MAALVCWLLMTQLPSLVRHVEMRDVHVSFSVSSIWRFCRMQSFILVTRRELRSILSLMVHSSPSPMSRLQPRLISFLEISTTFTGSTDSVCTIRTSCGELKRFFLWWTAFIRRYVSKKAFSSMKNNPIMIWNVILSIWMINFQRASPVIQSNAT